MCGSGFEYGIRIQFRSGSTSLVPTGSLHPPFRINEIVERFPNSKFGSYPSWVNQYYKTRISYECPTTQELGLLFTSLKTWDPSPLAAIRYTMMGFVLRKFFLNFPIRVCNVVKCYSVCKHAKVHTRFQCCGAKYVHCVWIRIQKFAPIWIRIRGISHIYIINFEEKNEKIFLVLNKFYYMENSF